jgi:hypothetical protein
VHEKYELAKDSFNVALYQAFIYQIELAINKLIVEEKYEKMSENEKHKEIENFIVNEKFEEGKKYPNLTEEEKYEKIKQKAEPLFLERKCQKILMDIHNLKKDSANPIYGKNYDTQMIAIFP